MKHSIPTLSLLAALLAFSMPATIYATAPTNASPTEQRRTDCDSLDILKAKIHMAINSALQYPASMTFYAARGITTVKYVYLNGQVSSARVTVSSGNRILDRAALRAVRGAKYPAAPAAFQGVKIPDVVYVVFDNSDLMARNDTPTNSSSAFRRKLSKDEECMRK